MSYRPDKLLAHPVALQQFREGGDPPLISVHLMPQNTCNQRCSFCSYRLPDNKNSLKFDEGVHIPPLDMHNLLNDFQQMGVYGIEVTGGGEPLAYPHTTELWEELNRREFATALVTNGTLIRDRAELLTERMKWARVSIDAATGETYSKMRRCPENHYGKAWKAVDRLRAHAPDDPEFRLGVGFVLCNENIDEILPFVKRASESGADNVRLSLCFSDQHLDFFNDQDALRRAVDHSIEAEEFYGGEGFAVHNMIPTRFWEQSHPTQDYQRCGTKDVLCVVEGECKVYTCCTFTGSVYGLYGKFTDHPGGFKGLWAEYADWRRKFDASKYCQCACLYRERNLAMNAIISGDDHASEERMVHQEFI